jgi:DNA-binding NarL/FixJ family response regulator
VQRRLLEALAAGAALGVAEPATVPVVEDGLTAREVEVLVEIAEGRTNAEIAGRLFVSEATVKTHVNHLLAKTGCRDRAALVGYAFRTGRAGV